MLNLNQPISPVKAYEIIVTRGGDNKYKNYKIRMQACHAVVNACQRSSISVVRGFRAIHCQLTAMFLRSKNVQF